ncbi:unnamed protein product [Dimorphilus gyrociliatus]|uniref:Uncharacterized protein n=1 Tax=Dimorphilus gyrociliatus TaxID=2664684 RepID=A0A7I8VQ67_9ANNE|nr:unnamed protein product [Dimorphilus gyrociliatus]
MSTTVILQQRRIEISQRERPFIVKWRLKFQRFVEENKRKLKLIFLCLALIGYFIYFGLAIKHSAKKAKALIVITPIVVAYLIYAQIRDRYGDLIFKHIIQPVFAIFKRNLVKWIFLSGILVALVLYLGLGVLKTRRQLQSILGLTFYTIIPYFTSKHRRHIKWRPVIWGYATQFLMAVIVLRWKPGYNAARFLSDELNTFLSYSFEGAAQVFGDPVFILHTGFFLLALITFIGAVVDILFYFGVTKFVITKMAFIMSISANITAVEAFGLVANIFLSVLETSLMIKPYIKKLTGSEFHTFLVGAHSTIAGWAFGLFVLFGVNPQHLLTGALISAPAAVAIAKLSWPETEISNYKNSHEVEVEESNDRSVVEAMANGAKQAAKGVTAIMLQIIAFLSLLDFLDTTLGWIGRRIGIKLSVQIIFSYLFVPFAWLIGIEWSECRAVSSLLGLKMLGNEVLAFLELGGIQQGEGPKLSEHAATLTTYALCGFSSFGTLAIFIGVWSSIDPPRVAQVGSQFLRLFLNANLACFSTACIAGILYDEDIASEKSQPSIIRAFFNLLPSYKDILDLLQ